MGSDSAKSSGEGGGANLFENLAEDFGSIIDGTANSPHSAYDVRAVERTHHVQKMGKIGSVEQRFLRNKGIDLSDNDLVAIYRKIKHMFRDNKPNLLKPSDAAIRNLPSTTRNARAVLWDKSKNNLLYVYKDPSGKLGKIAVEVGFKPYRKAPLVNAPVHVQVGEPTKLGLSLKDGNKYELIKGKID